MSTEAIRKMMLRVRAGDFPTQALLGEALVEAIEAAIAAAREEGRREGFEKAREVAEGVAERCRKERETLSTNEYAATRGEVAQASVIGKMSEAERIRDAIRAMRDGAVSDASVKVEA